MSADTSWYFYFLFYIKVVRLIDVRIMKALTCHKLTSDQIFRHRCKHEHDVQKYVNMNIYKFLCDIDF